MPNVITSLISHSMGKFPKVGCKAIIKLSLAAITAHTMLVVPKASAEELITIGTAGTTGIYYRTGAAICRLVNKGYELDGLRCTAQATAGSMYNLHAIREGWSDFGLVQSDWQHHAYNGTASYRGVEPFENLRAVFSLHTEPLTVVVRADAGISTLEDLKGKRVNIGNSGSGQRGTMEVLMRALGWTSDDFALTSETKASEQSAALCADEFDAMIYTIGHPSGTVHEVTATCDSVLISVAGSAVEGLVSENSFYNSGTIPGGMYRGNESDVQTFSVGATFVASTNVSAKTVYAVVKSVMSNIEKFKKLHPAFADLNPKRMITSGLSAPLHPGAEKYYREQGWID